jgi:energy-coupling factor transport system permease protein
MLKDITWGQYYPAKSQIHKLDPRVKMFATVCYMLFLFANDFAAAYIINIVVLAVIVKMTNIPFGRMAKSLKAVFLLLLISVCFTILFTGGDNMIVHFGIIKISWQGILQAAKISLRLFLLIIMSTILTLTTMPTDLADGLEKAFRPLTKIGVPVHEIAMMITIALRFIPILMEETDKIMRAQKARGADFETGNFIQKAKKLIPIFIPLIVSAVRRSNDLAMAMEARCYRGGEGRTKMKPLIYQTHDKIAYGFIGIYTVLMLVLWVLY